MKKIVSIVLNKFTNDSRVLKENLSLQKIGYDVQVIALWEDGLKEFEKIQNIPVHRIKLKTKNWSKNKFIQLIKYFELIFKVVKKYKNCDVIHCNDINTLPIGVIIKKFFNKDIKIVYDAHEYETEMNGLKGIEKFLVKMLEKYLIKYVDKVITVSESIANEYKKLYPFIEKPAVVLNAPPYKKIERKNIFREKFNISTESPIFLYQGAFSRGRGIESILEAFKELNNNYQLMSINTPVIVFMGYGELEKEIRKASKEYDNIYFQPAVPLEILLDYTSSADFGIHMAQSHCLSYYYALPNKVLEYIMAELPILVTDLPEMAKIVREYDIGEIIKENNKKSLIDAIIKIQQKDIIEMKKNIKKAKEIYNWENQEKILLLLYGELNEH